MGLLSPYSVASTRSKGVVVTYAITFYGAGSHPVRGSVALETNYLNKSPGTLLILVQIS